MCIGGPGAGGGATRVVQRMILARTSRAYRKRGVVTPINRVSYRPSSRLLKSVTRMVEMPRGIVEPQGQQTSLLSRGGKLILTSVLINSVPFGYMNVVPLVYLIELGYHASTVGAIYSASALANTMGVIPFGILADKYGRKNFLIVGSLIPSISYAIFAITLDPSWLIAAAIIGGVGFSGGIAVAISSPSLLPLLANSTSEKRRTTLFSLLEGIWILSLSIGSFLSILPNVLVSVLDEGSIAAHSQSYFVMSALAVISVFPLFFVKERVREGALRVGQKPASSLPQGMGTVSRLRGFSITSWRKVAKLSLVLGLAGLGLGASVQLLPTWYNLKFGISESVIGPWIGVAQVVSLIGIISIPALVGRIGTVTASAGTGIAASLFFALMLLADTFEVAASLFIIRNVLATMSFPVLLSYMVGVVAERERATTIGIAYAAWGVTSSAGTLAGGYLLGADFLDLPLTLGIMGYLCSAVLLLLLFGKERPPEEGSDPTTPSAISVRN